MSSSTQLSGKNALITGATNGHGKAMAMGLAKAGAQCIIHGRSKGKCEAVQKEIKAATGSEPRILLCNLSSLEDVRRAAKEFLSWKIPLHILVNNAGLVNQKYQESAEGFEETMAVNYIAHFLFTNLILDSIKKAAPSQIINISSDNHRISKLSLDELEPQRGKHSLLGDYGKSKLALVYFTRELAARLEGAGVRVNAVDPGPVASGIAKKPGIIAKIADSIIQLTFPAPERAARSAMHLALTHDSETTTGGYFRFMKWKEPTINKKDPDFGKKLWDVTAQKVGL